MSVYPRADGIYVFDFQHKGLRHYGTTGRTTRREAKEIERQKREEVRSRHLTHEAQRTGPMTFGVALARFWEEVGSAYTGTYRTTVFAAVDWLEQTIGAGVLLRDLGPNKITEAIARRRGEGVSNATVNRTVTELLRLILRRAGRQWEQKDLPHIEWKEMLLAEPRERVRELRDHEEETLDGSMRADYLPAIKFAIASGMRKRELVNLRWSDVDLTAKTVTVLGKGEKARTIPLTRSMIAMLSRLRGQHDEFVFTYVAVATRRKKGTLWRERGKRYPITYSGLGSAWRRYGGAAAGLDDFRYHDLRHTTGTRVLRSSGNLKLVQKLLGHEQIATTTRYAHADDHDLREAMERLDKSRAIPRKKTDRTA